MQFTSLALAASLLAAATAANAQYPFSPEHCGAEVLDIPGIIACARLGEEGRAHRCAQPGERQVLPPTDGARVLEFGAKTQFGSTSKGVVFTGNGTVVAPSTGRVMFGGAFRSYGNLVVIDACEFDVLVAGIEALTVPARSLVEAGQPIGTSTGAGAVIYLEVRKGERAVNPFGMR